ncbi:periplasmic binding protein-like I [Polychytrium aggregatum]|uniref:periplasmic binding protein-like I n=1 Tax=Polychytrium aggregatum TaxID=110093 RepID=UPI0022FEADA5|nr:periplasmic binding protein-like I [Polychytrium aggregatum]KAI9202246.1 periplasmic binding protein-like I [Polychytrium aggregatum]
MRILDFKLAGTALAVCGLLFLDQTLADSPCYTPASCDWRFTNSTAYSLSKQSESSPVIRIGVFVPYSASLPNVSAGDPDSGRYWWNAGEGYYSALVAADSINKKSLGLFLQRLETVIIDDYVNVYNGDSMIAQSALSIIGAVEMDPSISGYHGFVGDSFYPPGVELQSLVASTYSIPNLLQYCSYSYQDELSEKKKNLRKTFFRTVADKISAGAAIVDFVQDIGWTKIAVLVTQNSAKGSARGILSGLIERASSRALTILQISSFGSGDTQSWQMRSGPPTGDWDKPLMEIASSNARIIVVLGDSIETSVLWMKGPAYTASVRLTSLLDHFDRRFGLTGPRYVWITTSRPGTVAELETLKQQYALNITTALGIQNVDSFYQVMGPKSVFPALENFNFLNQSYYYAPVTEGSSAPYIYDCVRAIALGYHKVLLYNDTYQNLDVDIGSVMNRAIDQNVLSPQLFSANQPGATPGNTNFDDLGNAVEGTLYFVKLDSTRSCGIFGGDCRSLDIASVVSFFQDPAVVRRVVMTQPPTFPNRDYNGHPIDMVTTARNYTIPIDYPLAVAINTTWDTKGWSRSLASVIIAINIAMLLRVWIRSKSPLISSIGPAYCTLLLLSSCLVLSSIFLYQVVPSDVNCLIRRILPNVSYGLYSSAILVRFHYLYTTQAAKRAGIAPVNPYRYMIVAFVVTLVEAVMLIITASLIPTKPDAADNPVALTFLVSCASNDFQFTNTYFVVVAPFNALITAVPFFLVVTSPYASHCAKDFKWLKISVIHNIVLVAVFIVLTTQVQHIEAQFAVQISGYLLVAVAVAYVPLMPLVLEMFRRTSQSAGVGPAGQPSQTVELPRPSNLQINGVSLPEYRKFTIFRDVEVDLPQGHPSESPTHDPSGMQESIFIDLESSYIEFDEALGVHRFFLIRVISRESHYCFKMESEAGVRSLMRHCEKLPNVSIATNPLAPCFWKSIGI